MHIPPVSPVDIQLVTEEDDSGNFQTSLVFRRGSSRAEILDALVKLKRETKNVSERVTLASMILVLRTGKFHELFASEEV